MARPKKKVRQPGFWAMVGRGWRLFKAFLGAEFWYCPHGQGRFCFDCRLWTLRQGYRKAGLHKIVKAGRGKSIEPAVRFIGDLMEEEELVILEEAEKGMLETEAEGVSLPGTSEDTAQSEPQPRPETEEEEEVCPACSNVKVVGGLCPMCGHQTGDEVPYEEPEAVEDPEDVE